MRIIRCDASHEAAWTRFVRRNPRASFYHRFEWGQVNGRCLGHETVALAAVAGDRDDEIVGVFPLVRLKSLLFGNIACSMPFVNYGGPCGDSDEIEDALLVAAEAVCRDWRVDYLEIRSRRHLGDRLPSSDHKVSMTIALDPDPEKLWAAFKTGHRQEIRRAYKHGFVAKFGMEHLADFYQVLSGSWRDLGTPIFSFDYLQAVSETFRDSTRLCVVYDAEGRPAAGAFDGIHDGVVEGMWLGTLAEYRKQLVGYVLYWELMKHACEQGYRRFHLGRSTRDSGGEQFKKKWNADVTQLYWHYWLGTRTEIPQLNPANPKYRLAVRTWQRLPLNVTQMLGPFIARSIP